MAAWEHAVHESVKSPLDSRTAIERCAKAITQVIDLEAQLGAAVGGLAAAMNKVRARQQEQAESISRRAQELKTRTEAIEPLLVRFGELGVQAGEVSRFLQGLGGEGEERRRGILEAEQRVGEVAAAAQSLRHDADSAGFRDVFKEADSIRQKLLAALGKLRILLDVKKL